MVELRALGPIEASVDDAPVTLGGPKQLTVLALLIAGRGHPVSDDALIDGVWGDSAGSGARATLQTYVSNLRGALGDHAIARTGDAYRLGLDPREVDVWQFEAAVATARELLPERPSDAAQQLRGALDLWRGDPYGGARECERLEEDRRELEALRLSALEDRMEAELAGAGSSALLGELSSLAQQHPLRERLQGLHMLGLYRAGRQGDAIEVYERTRRQLADQLGVDVSPQLRRLHQRILEQDPELLPDDTVGQQVAPPSGQVTFLFTDIEGSTRLFHELGPSYPDALQRHRQILREVWNDHGGYEATVEGDGSLVAFGSAGDAVRAAVAGQRSLAGEDWPGGADLRVRMGLHTGLASPRNGNYISLTVHEAARVMSAAHGGQVLLSEETAKRLEHLPEAELHARGRFRLRGFDEPVRLYEIVMDGLEHDFGPLRATPADRHNLVRQSTETIGREELIRTVVSELDAGHVVTLTGPGGVGKTRVASEVGARAVDDWEHGVWLVDLAAVSDADLVAGAVADAVGAPTRPGGDRTLDLTTHLADRRCVIILDNCEHLVAACRGLLDAVANACRGVAVLATSREPLHVHRESVRPVTPLDLPPRGTNDAATVRTSSAGALFEARASDVRPEFAIDDGNAADVAAICRGLDGLPLLIELAAALVPFQTTAEIRTVLRTQAELLRSADPSESERHRSVAGLIGWSYDLLDEAERAAFRRLAVFGGSFSLGTATPALTVGDLKPDEVPRLVWSLVDRSLVTADLGTNGTRYRLLATIRHYGRQRLDETDETGPVATALATSLLDEIGPWLPTEWTWVTEVGTEIDNLRAIVNLLPD
ncbi:MAG: BTAD domain-containing putative transcriptional regulator, partial [Nitriliruptorales bacterium]|nr:BTAD domain-containing putative transcriptional regulator [Nitriliruptorales bacterium]